MFLVITTTILDPETREYSTTIKLVRTKELAEMEEARAIEEFRQTALEIIYLYDKTGQVLPEWGNCDIENIIEENRGDLEETIIHLTFNCYKFIFIEPEEIKETSDRDIIFSTRLERFY